MRHQWEDVPTTRVTYGARRRYCLRCGMTQLLEIYQEWGRVVSRRWEPSSRSCVAKTRKAEHER